MSIFGIFFIILILIVVIAFSFVSNLLSGIINLFRSNSSKSTDNRKSHRDSYSHTSKKEYDDDDLVRSEEGEKRMKIFKESAESVDYEEVK
jgi:hypothetical protein